MAKIIKLTKGYEAIVDDADFEFLNQWKWQAHVSGTSKTVYASRKMKISGSRKNINVFMHRQIKGSFDREFVVDHINSDGLDNRKINLRLCTLSQNVCNTQKRLSNISIYKGVKKSKGGKYYASIVHDKKDIYLGRQPSEIAAALAYNEAAKKYHGEFARLNIIVGEIKKTA